MRTLLALGALLAPLAGAAQDTPWTRQPADVMGIRLGAPLESAGILPCDASNEMRGRISTTALCFHPRAAQNRPERTYYTVHNSPDFGVGGQRVMLDVAYGQVAGILVTGNALRFDRMVAVLEARYGPATETIAVPAHERAAPGPALTKRWRGDRVTIEAISPFGREDEFAVYWSDLGAQARREAQLARESSGVAGKL